MAEKRTIEVEIKDNSKNLKQQLREAQKEVEKLSELYGATSDAAVKAAKKAAELKDAIGDAKDLTDAFNPDAKFNALSNSIGGVLNGLQAYEGALGLVGVEGEAVQETLLKVQSAMALSQGLQGLAEAKDSFKQLGAVARNALQGIKTGIAATGIGLLLVGLAAAVVYWDKIKASIGLATEAQKANNAAKKAGLESISKELNAADKLSKSLKDETLTRAEKNKLIKQFQADYPGLLRNINLEKDSITSINKQLGDNIKLLQLQAEAKALASVREETYQKKSQLQLQLQQEALENASNWTLNYGESAENGFLGFSTAAENAATASKNLTDINNASTRSLDKQIKSLDESEKALLKKIEALKKAGAETEVVSQAEIKAEEDRKAKIEAAKQKAKEDLDKLKGFIKEASDYNKSLLRSDLDNEIATINEKYSERLALAKKLGRGEAEIREALLNEINDVKKKYALAEIDLEKEKQEKINQAIKDAEKQRLDDEEAFYEEYRQNTLAKTDLEIQDINDKYFRLIEEAKQYGLDTTELERRRQEEINKIDEESKEQQKARVEELKQARLKAVQTDLETSENGLKSIQNLFETFQNIKFKKIKEGSAEEEKRARQQFKFNKALQLGLAIIDGAKAVTASLAQSPIAIGPVPNPAGIASLATAVSSSALSISKIAAMQFDAGGGGSSASAPSGGGASGGGGQAPNFNIVGNSTANQLAQVEQKPVQAFVVSGEVTSAQALDRNRQVNATFG